MKSDYQLNQLRNDIDKLDRQLIDLVNQRAQLAIDIGVIKKSIEANPIFYRPERVADVLKKVADYNKGPLSAQDITNIFQVIMSVGLALQQPLKIAFLGPEGTFSQAACLAHFGPAIQPAPADSIQSVFQQVEMQQVQYGVVPIENSTEGVVNQTLDALIDTSLKICGEIALPIHQHLLVNPDYNATIERIYSHPQSLAQCQYWLNKHLPHAEKIAVSSNAQAAKLAEQEPGAGAIAGDLATHYYKLTKQAENIEDEIDNMTRFLIIGQQAIPASGNDKTTLLINTSNIPGALAQIILPFSKHSINITLPTCRPSRQKVWSYVFFLEIAGHQSDSAVQAALAELADQAISVRVLGSYPRSETSK